jgi:dihydrolipoamide dehydrogenase
MQVALVDEEKKPGRRLPLSGMHSVEGALHVAKGDRRSSARDTWGVTFASRPIDVDKLRAFKQSVVDKLTSGVGSVAKMRKVAFLQGRPTLTGPTSMTIAGPRQFDAALRALILATGSRPTRIPR